MGFRSAAKNVWTGVQVGGGMLAAVGNMTAPPLINKSTSTDLKQQYTEYVKEVRLPATERERKRLLDSATRTSNTPTTSLSKKDLKPLKKVK